MASRPRVVVASPHVAECAVLAEWLAAEGFEPFRATSVERASEEVTARAPDVLVIDHLFAFRAGAALMTLARARSARTALIVIGEPDAAREAQAASRGAMYLTRPLDRTSLICLVSMALIDGRPERRSARKRVNRFEAIVEGVPSHIVDISNEGLRLEVPRGRKSAPPPPLFNVTVPMLGVALLVRRMWTCNVPEAGLAAVWYGGELQNNSRRAELAWLRLVDTIPVHGTALEVQ